MTFSVGEKIKYKKEMNTKPDTLNILALEECQSKHSLWVSNEENIWVDLMSERRLKP
jgi:hypothetical protein